MTNLKLSAVLVLFFSVAQAVSLEIDTKEQRPQEEYLAQFAAAKKDPNFCRFVNSFESKSEYPRPYYDLPPQHLDCYVLSKENRARTEAAHKADKEVSKSFRKMKKTLRGHHCSHCHTCCHCASNNETNHIGTALALLELPIQFFSLVNAARLNQERENIETLASVQRQVRSSLAVLAPVYQRCKTLQPSRQEDCRETVKLDLYNVYANYLTQEQRLFSTLP